RLFVAEGIGLEGIQLDALRFNVPESSFDIVIAFEPDQIRRHAPVRVFPQRGAAHTEIVVAAVSPVGEGDEQAAVLVYVPKPSLLERIKSRLVLVLLTGIYSGPTGITGAH